MLYLSHVSVCVRVLKCTEVPPGLQMSKRMQKNHVFLRFVVLLHQSSGLTASLQTRCTMLHLTYQHNGIPSKMLLSLPESSLGETWSSQIGSQTHHLSIYPVLSTPNVEGMKALLRVPTAESLRAFSMHGRPMHRHSHSKEAFRPMMSKAHVLSRVRVKQQKQTNMDYT